MNATETLSLKPFRKLDRVFVAYRVPGSPYSVGEQVTIASVVNTGTKRNPTWRYYVAGAWFDHDALSLSNPLA
jgi:hypothetical protein